MTPIDSKSCPFCGGEPLMKTTLRDGCKDGEPDARAYFVGCRSCASQGGWAKNPHGAVRLWEMRVAETVSDEEISNLKAVILSIQESRQKAWDTLEAVHGIVSEKAWLRETPKGPAA